MKKLYLFFLLICITSGLFSQTLFTYGNNVVTRDEFLRAYNKNKTAVADKTMALKEYLDLYIKFKLKVKAAKDLRLDTLASLANDLKNFRSQIEDNYLNDNATLNKMVDEAYMRSQADIRVAHLAIPTHPWDYKDRKRISNVAQRLAAGESFASIAKDLQSQGIVARAADLGYITAFTVPYRFENIIYGIGPSGISKEYYEDTVTHFFQVLDRRKAVGKIKVAQILLAFPEGAKEEDRLKVKRIADSVYRSLKTGADFTEAARNISNDKMTYMSGGVMPEFGVGKYDPVFENKVFALVSNGDMTEPFLTSFGYHIVKLISKTAVPATRDESTLFAVKQQVLLDKRGALVKDEFVNGLLKKITLKKNGVNHDDLEKITDSFFVNPQYKIPPGKISKKTILFSVATSVVTVNDWLTFEREYRNNNPTVQHDDLIPPILMQKLIAKTVTDYYRKNLEKFNPEFKYQLQEFKDGNMLFEVMERNVWTKASNDTVGLMNYYLRRKSKYTWNESADAVLISCSDAKVATDATEKIRKGKNWRQLAEENTSQVQTDSARYELTQLQVKANTKFTEGMISEPLINENDGTATFVKIFKLYPANQLRSFEQARGLVINDYQSFLEEKWIEQLKKKYPVKVNEKVFQSLL